MTDAELIVAIRGMRKLVVALDSIGFPIQDLTKDKELGKLVPKDMSKRLASVTSDIHSVLQKIEHSKRYKDAVYTLCNVAERKTFILNGDPDGGEHNW